MPTFFIRVEALDDEVREYLEFVNNNLHKKDIVKNPFTEDSGVYRVGKLPDAFGMFSYDIWMIHIKPVYPHLWLIGALSLLITIAAHIILFPMPAWLYILDGGLIVISGIFYLSPVYMFALWLGCRVQIGRNAILEFY